MLSVQTDEFLYSEKYRPQKVSECILPQDIIDILQNIVNQREVPNMMFSGTSGLGKTTAAKALCEEIGCEYLFINASENNGIDVLRTTIRDFASTVSLSGFTKVVILDEADNMSAALQPALRGFIEEFSKTCRFILTCNHKNKIMAALHSRLVVIDFKFSKEEKTKLAAKFYKRVLAILEAENVTFEQKAVAEVVKKHFPDFRKTLNEFQRYVTQSGEVNLGILTNQTSSIEELIKGIKEKDFRKCRTWLVENQDIQPNTIIRALYDDLVPQVREAPNLILILGECQKYLPWVADTELHLAATIIEIMGTASFKDHAES